MMVLYCIGMALGLIAGIVMASLNLQLATVLLVPAVATGGLLSLLSLRDKRRWRPWHPALVTAAALALALPLGYWRTAAIIDTPRTGSVAHALQPLTAATRIGLRGHVAREPEQHTPGQIDLHLRVTGIRIGNTGDWQPVKRGEIRLHVYTYKENSPVIHERMKALASPQAYGYHIEALADYHPVAERLNPADSDYSSVLLQKGADASLRCHVARTTLLESTRCNPLMKLVLAAKTVFLDTIQQGIRAPASRLADATTLAPWRAAEPTNYLGRNIADTFGHAGVGHMLAVSGLHVSVIALLLFGLFRMTRVSPRLLVPPLIVFLILFALLTGARPSSLWAVIMNSVILVAFAYFHFSFRAATAIGLSLSSFLILLLAPVVLFSPSFLLSYGAVLALVFLSLAAEQQRHHLLDPFLRLFARLPRGLSRGATAVLPLLLLLPLLASLPRRLAAPVATRVDILAAGSYPLVLISGNSTADLINAGERIEGERLLFDSIRLRGATRVRNVLLPSPDARAGIQGATALLGKMPIGTLHLPVLPAPAQTLTEAIGDAYLLEQARQGTSWAIQYDIAFAALRTRAGEAGTRLAAIGSSPLADWQNLALTPLPRLQEPPPRFASSAITPLLLARIHGLNWIIVTDTTPEAVVTAVAGAPPCDVLVVPDLSHYRTYAKWMEHLMHQCPPRLLVVAGSRPLDDRLLERLLPEGCELIQTGRDGAVSATPQPDGSTRLTTYRTRRVLRLEASSRQPATDIN